MILCRGNRRVSLGTPSPIIATLLVFLFVAPAGFAMVANKSLEKAIMYTVDNILS